MKLLDKFLRRRTAADAEMSFLEHLEELRWHLLRSLMAVVLLAVFFFVNKKLLFDVILLGPQREDFWTFRQMCRLAEATGIKALCIKDFSFTLTNIQLAAQFMVHLKAAFILGVVLSFPYVLWEVWRFVEPGLYPREKRAASGVVLMGSVLFYCGVLFAYFLVVPFTVLFLGEYQVSSEIANQINLSSYIGTVTGLCFATGLMFEFPMVIYVLARLGLATHELLAEYRKIAVVVVLLLAAMITPSPDIFSQMLVALPLYGLYEVGIIISRRVSRMEEVPQAES
ncbi:MAG: twin-arginine translocase subunit TatC [Chitinophagales bacterium]|nr:twin-arginine translocase subunit TatC [Chitinophagales bacterium]MDW8427233.1 twin-arginine translocase subunit TatC [Chitinophagales bacterium]